MGDDIRRILVVLYPGPEIGQFEQISRGIADRKNGHPEIGVCFLEEFGELEVRAAIHYLVDTAIAHEPNKCYVVLHHGILERFPDFRLWLEEEVKRASPRTFPPNPSPTCEMVIYTSPATDQCLWDTGGAIIFHGGQESMLAIENWLCERGEEILEQRAALEEGTTADDTTADRAEEESA